MHADDDDATYLGESTRRSEGSQDGRTDPDGRPAGDPHDADQMPPEGWPPVIDEDDVNTPPGEYSWELRPTDESEEGDLDKGWEAALVPSKQGSEELAPDTNDLRNDTPPDPDASHNNDHSSGDSNGTSEPVEEGTQGRESPLEQSTPEVVPNDGQNDGHSTAEPQGEAAPDPKKEEEEWAQILRHFEEKWLVKKVFVEDIKRNGLPSLRRPLQSRDGPALTLHPIRRVHNVSSVEWEMRCEVQAFPVLLSSSS